MPGYIIKEVIKLNQNIALEMRSAQCFSERCAPADGAGSSHRWPVGYQNTLPGFSTSQALQSQDAGTGSRTSHTYNTPNRCLLCMLWTIDACDAWCTWNLRTAWMCALNVRAMIQTCLNCACSLQLFQINQTFETNVFFFQETIQCLAVKDQQEMTCYIWKIQ